MQTHTQETPQTLCKSHVWLVTIFPSSDEWEKACQYTLVELLAEECAYLVCGKELAPSTGREHWHVYLRHHRLLYGYEVQDKLGGKWNLTVCTRGAERAVEYVKKGGDFKEWGVVPTKVPRSIVGVADTRCDTVSDLIGGRLIEDEQVPKGTVGTDGTRNHIA